MSEREQTVLIYSKDLAQLCEVFQKGAVHRLRQYVREHEGIWEYKEGKKMEKAFEPFFSGEIMLLKQFADTYDILFQPEVIRGELTASQREEVEMLGFEPVAFTP